MVLRDIEEEVPLEFLFGLEKEKKKAVLHRGAGC